MKKRLLCCVANSLNTALIGAKDVVRTDVCLPNIIQPTRELIGPHPGLARTAFCMRFTQHLSFKRQPDCPANQQCEHSRF